MQQKQITANHLFETMFEAVSSSYTKLFPLNSISLPDFKMVLRKGTQVVIEQSKLINSKEIPTHEIVELKGTLANNKFEITVRNIYTDKTEIIQL